MSTGFNNDQFFGAGKAGEEQLSAGPNGHWATGSADNPPFKFPGNTIRNQSSSGNVYTTKIQRGYIRSLMTDMEGVSLQIRKCAFQFNPERLATSVAMAQDLLNMMQQDIGQFSVPVAANTNFQFSIDFDRSMELNESSNLSGVNPDMANNMLLDLNPNQVGVLRDIAALNAVIGVGLTPQSVDYAQKVAMRQIVAEQEAQGSSADAAKYEKAKTNVPNIIGAVNFGNSAFLQPLPVRVVFSSLFIVEGFVSNVDIEYQKFTSTMVPMRARCTLQMVATYVGYAKKSTFTTESLKSQHDTWVATQSAATAAQIAHANSLIQSFPSVKVALLYKDNWNGPDTTLRVANVKSMGSQKYGSDWLQAVCAWSTTDKIKNKLDSTSDQDATIHVDASVDVYGPLLKTTDFVDDGTLDSKLHKLSSSVQSDIPDWSHLYGIEKIANTNWGSDTNYRTNYLNKSTVGKVVTSKSTPPEGTLVDTSDWFGGNSVWMMVFNVSVTVTIGADSVTGHGKSYKSVSNPAENNDSATIWNDVVINWDGGIMPGSTLPPANGPQSNPSVSPSTVFVTPPVVKPSQSRAGSLVPGTSSTVGATTTTVNPKPSISRPGR